MTGGGRQGRRRSPEEPLPADPGIGVSRLANGLSVWLRPHRGRVGGVGMALCVHAGSLGEAEGEQGISHLLEHLAFEGGERFSREEMDRFFEAQKTRLGTHHNAYTGREWTTFLFSFPKAAALWRGLELLADIAFGLRFPPAALETERRVVLEEIRGHGDLESRILAARAGRNRARGTPADERRAAPRAPARASRWPWTRRGRGGLPAGLGPGDTER